MLFIAFYRQIPTDHTFAAYCDHMDLKHLYHSVAKAIIDLKLDKTFTYYCETTLTTVFFTIEYLSKDEKIILFESKQASSRKNLYFDVR